MLFCLFFNYLKLPHYLYVPSSFSFFLLPFNLCLLSTCYGEVCLPTWEAGNGTCPQGVYVVEEKWWNRHVEGECSRARWTKEWLFLLTIGAEGQRRLHQESDVANEGITRDGLEKGEWMAFISGSDPGHKEAQPRRAQGRPLPP